MSSFDANDTYTLVNVVQHIGHKPELAYIILRYIPKSEDSEFLFSCNSCGILLLNLYFLLYVLLHFAQ